MFCVKGIGCPCCTLSTFYPVLKNIGIEKYRDLEQVTKLFFKHFCARNHNRSSGHHNISLRFIKSRSLLYVNRDRKSYWIIEQKFALAGKNMALASFMSHKNAGLQKQKINHSESWQKILDSLGVSAAWCKFNVFLSPCFLVSSCLAWEPFSCPVKPFQPLVRTHTTPHRAIIKPLWRRPAPGRRLNSSRRWTVG